MSPEEKRFPFFQFLAALSKPFPSGRVFFWGWVYICPPWSRHRSSAHKVLCYGQSKTDTWIETERRKKDEGSYADQEALDDRIILLPLRWIVYVGVWFGCAESSPPRVETLPPRVKRCPLNEENLGPVLVCVLLKKPLETLGACLPKAVLLHLHGLSIPKLHVLQSHCLVAVEIVSQIQRSSMLWCAEPPQLLL